MGGGHVRSFEPSGLVKKLGLMMKIKNSLDGLQIVKFVSLFAWKD